MGGQEILNRDISRCGAENLSFVGITAELTDEKLASLFDSENPRSAFVFYRRCTVRKL
jgi:hypothetical protein